MHKEVNLIGADMLLRRAIALGDTEQSTLDLFRTVEFILEDSSDRLP